MKRTLEQVLQAAYEDEINVTITTCWNDGFHVGLIDYMQLETAGRPIDFVKRVAPDESEAIPGSPWRTVVRAEDLAEEIHRMILEQRPGSRYERDHRVS